MAGSLVKGIPGRRKVGSLQKQIKKQVAGSDKKEGCGEQKEAGSFISTERGRAHTGRPDPEPPPHHGQLKVSRRKARGPPEKGWRLDTDCLIVSTLPQPDPPFPTSCNPQAPQTQHRKPVTAAPPRGERKALGPKGSRVDRQSSHVEIRRVWFPDGDWMTPGPPGSSSMVSFHDNHKAPRARKTHLTNT